jgi:hypothetical protein
VDDLDESANRVAAVGQAKTEPRKPSARGSLARHPEKVHPRPGQVHRSAQGADSGRRALMNQDSDADPGVASSFETIKHPATSSHGEAA